MASGRLSAGLPGAGDPDADSWYLNTLTEYLFRLMI